MLFVLFVHPAQNPDCKEQSCQHTQKHDHTGIFFPDNENKDRTIDIIKQKEKNPNKNQEHNRNDETPKKNFCCFLLNICSLIHFLVNDGSEGFFVNSSMANLYFSRGNSNHSNSPRFKKKSSIPLVESTQTINFRTV